MILTCIVYTRIRSKVILLIIYKFFAVAHRIISWKLLQIKIRNKIIALFLYVKRASLKKKKSVPSIPVSSDMLSRLSEINYDCRQAYWHNPSVVMHAPQCDVISVGCHRLMGFQVLRNAVGDQSETRIVHLSSCH